MLEVVLPDSAGHRALSLLQLFSACSCYLLSCELCTTRRNVRFFRGQRTMGYDKSLADCGVILVRMGRHGAYFFGQDVHWVGRKAHDANPSGCDATNHSSLFCSPYARIYDNRLHEIWGPPTVRRNLIPLTPSEKVTLRLIAPGDECNPLMQSPASPALSNADRS